MKYLWIVAVLVVLGGGILLFTIGGDDSTEQATGPTVTETGRGRGDQATLATGEAAGGNLPAAPQVSDDAITGPRRSATVRGEISDDATAAPADAPMVTAALEDDEGIERGPVDTAREEDSEDSIERRPLAEQPAAVDQQESLTTARDAQGPTVAPQAPAQAAEQTPAEDVAATPKEERQALIADGGGDTQAPEAVPAARAGEVAQAPAERVEAAPKEQENALVADGKDEAGAVRTFGSRLVGAPSGTVTNGALPGVRGIESRTGRRPVVGPERDRTIAAVRELAPIEAITAKRTKVAALDAGAPKTQVTVSSTDGKGPTFDVVRISAAGNAVLAGRAEPGADVVVLDRGTALGQVKANRRGEWVLVPLKPLPPGATELYVEAALPGVSPRQSEDVVVLSVPRRDTTQAAPARTLAVLTPRGGGTTRVLQAPKRPALRSNGGPGVSLDVVDYDDAGNIVLSGRADPEAEVRVYTDNRLIGTARSDKAGDWRLEPEVPITPGDHELRVDSVSVDGKVLARSVLPFSRADLEGFDLRDGRVVVQPGNSLWRIARATYGSGIQFTLIYDANKDQIRDPDLIFPGQVFKVPETN